MVPFEKYIASPDVQNDIKLICITPNFDYLYDKHPSTYKRDVLCWIRQTKIGTHTTQYNTEYRRDKYEFLDNNLKPTKLEINKWELVEFSNFQNRYSDEHDSYCKIADSLGNTKKFVKLPTASESGNEYTQPLCGIHGICISLAFISNKLSKFNTWKIYNIYEENKVLKHKLSIKTFQFNHEHELTKKLTKIQHNAVFLFGKSFVNIVLSKEMLNESNKQEYLDRFDKLNNENQKATNFLKKMFKLFTRTKKI